MLKKVPIIYKVENAGLFEKPCYFISKHDIYEFDRYITKQFKNWLYYEWWGYVDPFEHKVINKGGYSRYWSDGSTTNR